MAWGKPPYKSPGVAIYKVCMTNEIPASPSSFSEEGSDFIEKCLNRNPYQRPDAIELLKHKFCKYNSNDINSNTLQTMLQTVRVMDESSNHQNLNNNKNNNENVIKNEAKENEQVDMLSYSTDCSSFGGGVGAPSDLATPWGSESGSQFSKVKEISKDKSSIFDGFKPSDDHLPQHKNLADFSQSSSGWGSFGAGMDMEENDVNFEKAMPKEDGKYNASSHKSGQGPAEQDEDDIYEDDFEECEEKGSEQKR